MKKSVMKKWVAALRSGKYKQTRNRLKGKYGYCCLGVLCDISKQGEWDGNNYNGCCQSLPDEVQEFAGLKEKNPEVKTGFTLAEYNDKSKYSFKKIANIIEKHWKDL